MKTVFLVLSFSLALLVGCSAKDGTPGMTVSTNMLCGKVVTLSSKVITLTYKSQSFSTGDRNVVCQISTPAGSFENSQFYKAIQPGAQSGSCIVTASISGTTGGVWTFGSQNATSSLSYTDASDPNNGFSYTYLTTDCTNF